MAEAQAGVKMNVTGLEKFKQDINQGKQAVKTLDAELKLNEKQFKANGDSAEYMAKKNDLLKKQIEQQKSIIKATEEALEKMRNNGVNPASSAFQTMAQQLANSRSALIDMENKLDGISSSATTAAKDTDTMVSSLQSVNKKISFDAVLNGLNSITNGMENVAKKVSAIAGQIWDNMTSAAAWSDDLATTAMVYGIDAETLQRMQMTADLIDTPVEAIIKAREKLKQNMMYGSADAQDVFTLLGINVYDSWGKYGGIGELRDAEDVFWELGDAIMNFANETERDAMAQKVFGRSWRELLPLFSAGRDEYNQTMEEQSIVTQENVDKLNQLDDAVQKMKNQFDTLKMTVASELAPAFTELANGVTNLLKQFNDYLQTEEGQKKMEDLGEAVKNLFSGIGDIDFANAINTVSNAIGSLTSGLNWIAEHQNGLVTAIEALAFAFGTLKVGSDVLTFLNAANGAKNLLGIGKAKPGLPGIQNAATPEELTPNADPNTADEAINNSAKKGFLPALAGAAKTAGKVFVELAADAASSGALGVAALAAGETLLMKVLSDASVERERKALADRLGREITYEDIEEESKKYFENPDVAENTWVVDASVKSFIKQWMEMNGAAPTVANAKDFYMTAEEMESFLASAAVQTEIAANTRRSGVVNNTVISMEGDQLIKPETEEPPKMEVSPFFDSVAFQQMLQEKQFTVPVVPDLKWFGGISSGINATAFGDFSDGSHANGLPFVPFDGYIGVLHKGERVVPANQNSTRSYNSNLYVESMYMNNGADAQGLAAAMAAENRRISNGYGS